MVEVVMVGKENPQPEPVRNLEFREDGSQVGLDGSLGNVQPSRDLLVARTLADQLGDLALPGR
jgi:hypothetical protein